MHHHYLDRMGRQFHALLTGRLEEVIEPQSPSNDLELPFFTEVLRHVNHCHARYVQGFWNRSKRGKYLARKFFRWQLHLGYLQSEVFSRKERHSVQREEVPKISMLCTSDLERRKGQWQNSSSGQGSNGSQRLVSRVQSRGYSFLFCRDLIAGRQTQ